MPHGYRLTILITLYIYTTVGQVRKGAVGGGNQTSHCWDESLKISRRSDHVERVTVGAININSYLASYSYMTTYRNICRYVCMHVSMQTYMSDLSSERT